MTTTWPRPVCITLLVLAGCEGTSVDPSADASSASTSTPADDTRGTTDTATTGAAFVGPKPDLGGDFECSYLTQDCPAGEKCMPWSNDGPGWDASKCVPIADDPAVEGEPCHVEGEPYSGLDDCELGAICWGVDGMSLEGICEDFCIGVGDDWGGVPYCADPHEQCDIHGDGSIVLCLAICDPLQPDCASDDLCMMWNDTWRCASDASGDAGAYGDTCTAPNGCDPGLACVDSDWLPLGLPCEGTGACCTVACDIDDPAGDLQCPGAAAGEVCRPYSGDVVEPPTILEHVGLCRLPK